MQRCIMAERNPPGQETVANLAIPQIRPTSIPDCTIRAGLICVYVRHAHDYPLVPHHCAGTTGRFAYQATTCRPTSVTDLLVKSKRQHSNHYRASSERTGSGTTSQRCAATAPAAA